LPTNNRLGWMERFAMEKLFSLLGKFVN